MLSPKSSEAVLNPMSPLSAKNETSDNRRIFPSPLSVDSQISVKRNHKPSFSENEGHKRQLSPHSSNVNFFFAENTKLDPIASSLLKKEEPQKCTGTSPKASASSPLQFIQSPSGVEARDRLKTMIADVNAQEKKVNSRISCLIKDVKSFLEENDRVRGK